MSPDDGASWIDLVTTRSTTADVPLADLPTGTDVLFKVLASDGLRSTEDVVGPFVIANRPPSVTILRGDYSKPPSPIALPFGAIETLRGAAYDSDDGPLDGSALAWTLSGFAEGSGSGESFPLSGLAPGDYTVELQATDAGNLDATDTLAVTIGRKPIVSAVGIDLDGRCADPAYAADPNRLELRYADGVVAEIGLVSVGGYVYACASGLPVGTNPATAFFDLRLDGDGSQDPFMQTDDYYVRQVQSGLVVVATGNGSGGHAFGAPPIDATIVASDTSGSSWSVEYRLAESLLDPEAALSFMHTFQDGSGGQTVTWPSGMNALSPATWGAVGDDTPPPGSLRMISWDGLVAAVPTDTGQGVLTGAVPGQTTFDGYFIYPDACATDCTVSSFTDGNAYEWSGASGSMGVIRGLGVTAAPDRTRVEVVDDAPITTDLAAAFATVGVGLQVGSSLDGWLVKGLTDVQGYPASAEWTLIVGYSTSDPLASSEFLAAPPPGWDFVVLSVEEQDGQVFEAFGNATVPEPGVGIGLAVGVLSLLRRRRSSDRRSAGLRH